MHIENPLQRSRYFNRAVRCSLIGQLTALIEHSNLNGINAIVRQYLEIIFFIWRIWITTNHDIKDLRALYESIVNFEGFDVQNLSVAGSCVPSTHNSLPYLETTFENSCICPCRVYSGMDYITNCCAQQFVM